MGSTSIPRVSAWEILDSRGNPTVACEVQLADRSTGSANVPSGKSKGRHEVHELRDGEARFGGLGVRRAVENVRVELAEAVIGVDAGDQEELDRILREADGTADLSRLGANAVLAISVASACAVAASQRAPLWSLFGEVPLLPLPMVNIISGGAHAGRLIDLQDLLVIPVGASSFGEAIEWAARVRWSTANVAAAAGLPSYLIADEGGLAGTFSSNRAAIELLVRGIEEAGFVAGEDVSVALDVAASQFYMGDTRYRLESEKRELQAEELIAEVTAWCEAFAIRSVEDLLEEDDWSGWASATAQFGDRQLIGDDLFATNLDRLEVGISQGVANAVLVKPNQAGTLTGAVGVLDRARTANYATIVSARSGDTEDSWLADLAVGCRAGQIKVGSTMRSERTAKWNRLLSIEAALGDRAEFAGVNYLAPLTN